MNKHGGYYGEDQNNVIDFSVNINPLGVSKNLVEALKKELEKMERYPEIDGISAKEILAKHLSTKSEKVILGNGATELIYLFARSINPKKVLIVQPTFTEYKKAFELVGSSIYSFVTKEEDNFTIHIGDLVAELDSLKPDVLVLCNPNNPTGTFTNMNDLIPVLNKLKEIGGYLFIDESFIDFTDEVPYLSLIYEYNIFILRSMTKIFAVPGLRLGYGVANEETISRLYHMKEPWTINSLALSSVPILLNDVEYTMKTKKWYEEEKKFLFQELDKIKDIKVFHGKANFFLIKLLQKDSYSLKKYLLSKDVYIRTCDDFIGLSNEYIRVAVRNREENIKLVSEIREYFEKLSS